jgi:hypothetical protein
VSRERVVGWQSNRRAHLSWHKVSRLSWREQPEPTSQQPEPIGQQPEPAGEQLSKDEQPERVHEQPEHTVSGRSK